MVYRKQSIIKWLYLLTFLTAVIICLFSIYTILTSTSNTVKDPHVIAFANGLIILVLLPVPYLLFKRLGYQLPLLLHLYHVVFIWLSLVIGEIIGIYRITTYYDSIIHIIGGYLIALIGLYLVHTMARNEKRVFILLFVFSFTQGVAVIWELFEFLVDFTVGSNMQSYFDDINQVMFTGQDALKDTMLDLALNMIGMIICLLTYSFYPQKLQFEKIKGLAANSQ